MPASTDGTRLSPGQNGDLITDEDLSGLPRGTSDVPQLGSANAGYKIERTKIVVGRYGRDEGDADQYSPLYVSMARERALLEADLIARMDSNAIALKSRQYEKISFTDRRGHTSERGNFR